MPFILKINVRHTEKGTTIRTIRKYNNFVFNRPFNSLASTFEFDYFFDPRDEDSAEIICVSHMHECIIYHTTNTSDNYQPIEKERVLTGFLLRNKFRDDGKPNFVHMSGYARPGVLNDCDFPPDMTTESEGLTLRQILTKILDRFGIGLVIDPSASAGSNQKFTNEDSIDDKMDDDENKTAPDKSQNIGSYLTDLAKQRNIVLSHDAYGNVWVTKPNTKGTPVLSLDYVENESEVRKIPGIVTELEFNGQPLHTHITIVQDSDDTEESNAIESPPIRNPLIPVKAIYRPKTYSIKSGSEFSVNDAGQYELGREIREAIPLTISMGTAIINNKLASANETLMIRNPNLFLYNLCRWFIQSVDVRENADETTAVLNCVLPFGYDFDPAGLKNVFVDPHKNLPRF